MHIEWDKGLALVSVMFRIQMFLERPEFNKPRCVPSGKENDQNA
jgi:hypothetical protein